MLPKTTGRIYRSSAPSARRSGKPQKGGSHEHKHKQNAFTIAAKPRRLRRIHPAVLCAGRLIAPHLIKKQGITPDDAPQDVDKVNRLTGR